MTDEASREGREEGYLLAVAKALARIRDGSWSRCARCGGTIDARRLEALPTSTTCVACAA